MCQAEHHPTEPEIWTTDDLALAAFLVMQDHDIIKMEWKPPGDCYFVFLLDDDAAVMNDVVDFTGGLARVDPKEFILVYNRVKSAMLNDRPRDMDPRRPRSRKVRP
jgi:hypothetical protein